MSNSAHDQATFLQVVGAGMRAVEAVIRELAQSNVTVLLLAEAGGGKRNGARYIHENSGRSAEAVCFSPFARGTPQELHGLLPERNGFPEGIRDLKSRCQAVLFGF